ncbi:FAD:protein FMN transferase [Luteolibacter flavescens]|uniref:FAD:protein FMN transferase n=1 Tax=Luteolibacter flavescens TaxID=1859460 RepID=A0ABT3FNY3_9BACT|nr:FAD:protein FMN transferase [Luteolibacter flavescens]MCW1884929.1 FAD:protein FMN transferase [Luteolibacter flavescens]
MPLILSDDSTASAAETKATTYRFQTRRIFHCQVKVKLPAHHGEALLDRCFEVLERIDARYNSHQPGSLFSRINRHAGEWVEVDETCVKMIRTLGEISSLTHGSYDITCMPLIRLWGFYRTAGHAIPDAAALHETLRRVDHRRIEIDGHRVKIARGQEIITGSFLKAHAVDEVVRFLKAEGVTDAIINAGGSTIMALNDERHATWKVNLPHPDLPGIFQGRIAIANECFSLSARAHNKLVIGGKSYGHILDSRTGHPSATVQVGVRTRDAFLGDALSTALFSVRDDELAGVARAVGERFDFEYFHLSDHGHRTTSRACF